MFSIQNSWIITLFVMFNKVLNLGSYQGYGSYGKKTKFQLNLSKKVMPTSPKIM